MRYTQGMNDSEKSLQQSVDDLESRVGELVAQVKVYNSTRRSLWMAVLRGFASAIGATVVFGIVLAIVFQVIRSLDYVPIINTILNSDAIEEIVKQFTSIPQ